MARSAAILQPGSTEEVAAIVALAAERGVALVPQGGNTSMVGGRDAARGWVGADPVAHGG